MISFYLNLKLIKLNCQFLSVLQLHIFTHSAIHYHVFTNHYPDTKSILHWQDKPANLAMFEQKIKAITERTEIVVLPEMFSTGFSMQTASAGRNTWKKKRCNGCSAWPQKRKLYCNRKHHRKRHKKIITTGYVWMLPNGQYGLYDKRHLFAYAGGGQALCTG